jgi:outer membrane autotransporter protein
LFWQLAQEADMFDIKNVVHGLRVRIQLLALILVCLVFVVGSENSAAAQALGLNSYPAFPLQVGQSYFQPNYAYGGTSSYTYSLSAGALPAGVTLDSISGWVSGVPTVAGSFSYEITVTDSGSATASQTMSGTFAPPDLFSLVAGPVVSFGSVGDFLSQSNYISGGIQPYTYSVAAGNLPAGTTLDALGWVQGTLTKSGPFSYSISATDSSVPPQTLSQAVTGTVTPLVPLVLASIPSTYLQVGQPYSQVTSATGPGSNYWYFVASGALPAGTTLEGSTGIVSGTPTVSGAFSYTLGVSAQLTYQSPQLTISGTISPAAAQLTLALSLPSKMQVGQLYAQANVGGGGTPPYNFAVSGGALPAGTMLDPASGLVTGVPTAKGPFSYTVALTDSAGATQTVTQTVSGSIVAAGALLTMASSPSPTLRVGQAYWQFNFVSGGQPAYSYAVSAGRLPGGTTLDPLYGFVSGTPTAAGAFSYTITATDRSAVAQTASQAVSGAIAATVTSTMVSSSHNPAMLGQSVTLTATVTPSLATGAVTFRDGASTLCASAAIANGTASCTAVFSAAGGHPIRAEYLGAAAYATSAGVLTVLVNDQRAKTVQAVADFVKRRNDMILSNQPDSGRQIDRLNDISGGQGSSGAPLAANVTGTTGMLSALPDAGELSRFKLGGRDRSLAGPNGGLTGTPSLFGSADDDNQARGGSVMSGPVRMNGNTDSAMRFGFSTSLRDVARHTAETETRKAGGDDPMGFAAGQRAAASGRPNPFDIWIEGKITNFRDNRAASSIDGHFGAMTVGTDYVMNRSFLIGALVQFDSMRQYAAAQGTDVSGRGWMAGPYATVRLNDHVFWQVRGAWGHSNNEISPFQTYIDGFSSERRLASSSLAGRWDVGAWTLKQSASATYIEDVAKSYRDTFGAQIPEIKSTLGQAKAGPEVSYRYQAASDLAIEPRAGVHVIWNFAGGTTAAGFNPSTGEAPGVSGMRGQAEVGIRASRPSGFGFDLSGSYDGIGSNGYSAVTGKATVQMPLN